MHPASLAFSITGPAFSFPLEILYMYVISSLYFISMIDGTIFLTTDPASELNATVEGIMEVCVYFTLIM